MTFNPGGQGGFARPPLENAASAALASARGRLGGRPPFPQAPPQPLTPQQQAEALDTIAKGGGCQLCGGIHAAAGHGCPRLASFRLDPDGKIIEGTYWQDGHYDTSGILYATDAVTQEGGEGT